MKKIINPEFSLIGWRGDAYRYKDRHTSKWIEFDGYLCNFDVLKNGQKIARICLSCQTRDIKLEAYPPETEYIKKYVPISKDFTVEFYRDFKSKNFWNRLFRFPDTEELEKIGSIQAKDFTNQNFDNTEACYNKLKELLNAENYILVG